MKIKPKASFKKLDISDNYQGLSCEEFFALKRGEMIEIDKIPSLIKKHVEIVKKGKKHGN